MQEKTERERILAFFAREHVESSSAMNVDRFARWVSQRGSGETLEVVSPVCPDYAFERIGDRMPRYTFDSLGGDIGMAGDRLLRFLPKFHSLLCDDLGVASVRHHAYVGDTEGFSSESLRRVRASPGEFADKALQSVESYRRAAGDSLITGTLSSLCGGESGWKDALREMRAQVHSGKFAKLLDPRFIAELGQSEKSRYERWFTEEEVDHNLLAVVVIRRAIEIATIGKLIVRAFRDPLILSVGDNKLSQFFALTADVPVLDLTTGPS